MGELRHSPGPWSIKTSRYDQPGIYAADRCCVADRVYNGMGNALAIKAAPDLLAACQQAFPTLDALERHLGCGLLPLITMLRQAIAKATDPHDQEPAHVQS